MILWIQFWNAPKGSEVPLWFSSPFPKWTPWYGMWRTWLRSERSGDLFYSTQQHRQEFSRSWLAQALPLAERDFCTLYSRGIFPHTSVAPAGFVPCVHPDILPATIISLPRKGSNLLELLLQLKFKLPDLKRPGSPTTFCAASKKRTQSFFHHYCSQNLPSNIKPGQVWSNISSGQILTHLSRNMGLYSRNFRIQSLRAEFPVHSVQWWDFLLPLFVSILFLSILNTPSLLLKACKIF